MREFEPPINEPGVRDGDTIKEPGGPSDGDPLSGPDLPPPAEHVPEQNQDWTYPDGS